MAAGNILSAYIDWDKATSSARITTPTHPLQLVTRHTFLWKRLWKNNGMPIDGGKNIEFYYIPKTAGTFEEVLAGTPTTPQNPQVLQKGTAEWRFTRAHSTYTDPEFLLNDKMTSGSRKAMFECFVKIRDEKRTIRKSDVAVGLEGQLSAVPHKARMEGALTADATSPFSVFAHLNEGTNGLFGSGYTTSVAGGAFTTKQNITPGAAANDGNMKPQVQKYSTTGLSQPTNLIGGLDGLFMEIDWEQPDSLSQYNSDEALNNLMLLSTKQCRQAVMSLMRGDNDRYLMGPQDPANSNPQFRGIPIRRWDPLETAAVYDHATTLTTEGLAGGSQKKGPRVYAVNGNHMFPIAHSERLFHEDVIQRDLRVPDTWVQYESTWWQLICKSYKHQGLLVPSADCYIDGNTGGNLYA